MNSSSAFKCFIVLLLVPTLAWKAAIPADNPDSLKGDLVGNLFDPVSILEALDVATPDYFSRVDQGQLTYPAYKRSSTDVRSDVRSVWEDTRIEAMRYV